MKKKEYREAYKALEPEFAIARAVIQARALADLTQEQLAQRMDTTLNADALAPRRSHRHAFED